MNTTANAENAKSTAEMPGIGAPVSAEGVTVTLNSAHLTTSIEMHPESGYADNIVTERAREDGTYVVVEATVKNGSTGDMDLTCASTGSWIHAELETDLGASYQPLQGLHRIPGNPECNWNLGAGFDTPMTWVFLIPKTSLATKFGFFHSEDSSRKLNWIELDVPKTPEMENTSTTPSPAATPSVSELQQSTPTIIDEAPASSQIPVAPQPVAAESPTYGGSCTHAQILQPAVGPDGSNLVCLDTGGPLTWVYSAEPPRGAGTAYEGGSCEGYEVGGQDELGHMMMCIDDQWIYGP